MLSRLGRLSKTMAWNPYRFIPPEWFRAAQESEHRRTGHWQEAALNPYQFGLDGGYYALNHPPPVLTSEEGAERKARRKFERRRERKLDKFLGRLETKYDKIKNKRLGHNDRLPRGRRQQNDELLAHRHQPNHKQFALHHTWQDQDDVVRSADTDVPSTSTLQDHTSLQKSTSDTPEEPTNSTDNDQPSRLSSEFDESDFELQRKWESLNPRSSLQGNFRAKAHIRVISYNILSQKLLELNNYLYKKCMPEILNWDYRWSKIKAEIKDLDPEILCLQEVEECHYHREIMPFLSTLRYQCHYKRRTGNNRNKPDGVLIAFKLDHFTLLHHRDVEYKRGRDPPINQDNVGVITLLKPKANDFTEGHICVVNTHLLYNPRRGETKLVQLSTLFSEIHDVISKDGRDVPIILCGDFNSLPESHLFNFIINRELSYEGLDARHISGQKLDWKGRGHEIILANPLIPRSMHISENGCIRKSKSRLNAVAPDTENDEGAKLSHYLGPFVSAYCHDKLLASTTQNKGVTVDFIFHTRENQNFALFPTRRLLLVAPEELQIVESIPNPVHPSDHLPLVVDFALIRRY